MAEVVQCSICGYKPKLLARIRSGQHAAEPEPQAPDVAALLEMLGWHGDLWLQERDGQGVDWLVGFMDYSGSTRTPQESKKHPIGQGATLAEALSALATKVKEQANG